MTSLKVNSSHIKIKLGNGLIEFVLSIVAAGIESKLSNWVMVVKLLSSTLFYPRMRMLVSSTD